MDERWSGSLERLSQANARREMERLRSMTPEESARHFEELCRVIHAEFPDPFPHKTHPVGLIKYWKPRVTDRT